MTPDELKKYITEYTEQTWNKGDMAAMDRYLAADYVHHDASRPDVRTLADYKQWGSSLLSAFPQLHVGIEDIVAEDSKAVKRWTATGVHEGELAGIPPTGLPVSFSGTTFYRLAHGKIAECWYIYDMFGLVQQLTAQAVVAAA